MAQRIRIPQTEREHFLTRQLSRSASEHDVRKLREEIKRENGKLIQAILFLFSQTDLGWIPNQAYTTQAYLLILVIITPVDNNFSKSNSLYTYYFISFSAV